MSKLWKIVVAILFLCSALSTWHQLYVTDRFMSQGPRFTLQYGIILCERLKELEMRYYGFHDYSLKPLDCSFGTSK